MPRKFKVGDWVKVGKPLKFVEMDDINANAFNYYSGMIGEIIDFNTWQMPRAKRYPWRVKFLDEDWDDFNARELEAVSDAELAHYLLMYEEE